MLKDILNIINRDGFISKSKISTELNMSDELVEFGFNDLLRMGYLLEDNTSFQCEGSCSGCAYGNSCKKEIIKTYIISEKGNNFLMR